MTKVVIDVIYGFFQNIVYLICHPIFILLEAMLDQIPGYDSLLNIMNIVFDTYIFPFTYWFASIIPPRSLEVILLELSVLMLFITIALPVQIVFRVLKLIKKIPLA